MSQEFGVLPGVDVDPYTIAVYESGGAGEIDSKAFSAEHVISYQHICFQSVNQVQLAGNGRVDLTAIFVKTRDVDRC